MKKRGSQEEKKKRGPKLREKAEKKLARSPGASRDMPEKTPAEIIHELQVHQIELEMQNEELRRTQLALEESRGKYIDLYDFAPVGYFTLTDKSLIAEVNLTGAGLLGVAREKLANGRFRRFVLPEDQGLWDRYIMSVLKGEKKQTCDLFLRRADGATFPAHLESVRLTAGDGAAVVRIMVSDITRRRQTEGRERLVQEVLYLLNRAELSLDRLGEILQLVQKNMGFEAVGIRLKEGGDFPYYETKGFGEDFVRAERYLCQQDKAGKIVHDGQGNPMLECMCGNILCGRIDPTLPFFTEGGSFWTNSTTDLLASTTLANRQTHTRNRCNKEGYESVALIPLRSEDRIIGLLQLNDRRCNQFTQTTIIFMERLCNVIGIALSRMRADEALQKKTKELEASNEELEGFNYTISHDLRSPLRAIDGYARMLQKELSDRGDNGLRKIKVIRENTRRMDHLISDLLAFSRLGKQALAIELLDMTGLVRKVWQEVMETHHDGEVNFRTEALPPVSGDRMLIKQVWVNLLSNALKFTKLKDAADIQVGSYHDGAFQIFFVRDNGAGFDARYVGKLFGIFQRLHSAEEFEGTGVGLAIVQQIIRRHGGKVWAEGKVDGGATFYFGLPSLTKEGAGATAAVRLSRISGPEA